MGNLPKNREYRVKLTEVSDKLSWKTTTLGEVITLQRGFDLPEAQRELGLHPIVASTGVVGTHAHAMVKGPGVVIGRSGSLGGGQYIKSDFWPLNTTLWVKDFKNNNPRFCYFLLKSLNLAQFNVGSGVPTLNRNHIHHLAVSIPSDVTEQRRIAHVLGTLDDKIENNRKTAKTLEAMVQAIFKSWFVDFDPVRAKMAGESRESICKRLKITPEILDLFPDSLVDSELGEIPEGWVTGLLGSVLNLRRERCNPSQETMDRPYVPIECISSKSLSLTESKPGSQAQSSLTKFYKYDILFGAMRPYFHKVCIAPFNGTTRTTAFVLYPKDVHDFAFGIFSVFSEDTINYATINSTGSTIPYAVWENSLENMLIPIPPKKIRLAFNDVVGSMLLYITDNPYKQLTNLQIIRDTLLPKLISGEIRVPDAEHLVETSEA